MMSKRAVALGFGLLACGGNEVSSEAPPADARIADVQSEVDAAVPDTAVTDVAFGDAGVVDGATPDAALPDALPPDATPPVAGSLSPAARISRLDLPTSLATAQEMGCQVLGAKGGSGLAPIVNFVGEGGLSSLTQVNPDGGIDLVVFLQAFGLTDPPGTVGMRAFYGEYKPDTQTFLAAPETLDANGDALVRWPDTEIGPDGAFTAPGTAFTLTVDFGDAEVDVPPIDLRLEMTSIRGRLALEAPSFAVTEGFLEGYLTRDSLLLLIQDIKAICVAPSRPAFCDGLRNLLDPNAPAEVTLNLLLALVGGFDSAVREGVPATCSAAAGDCNAIGVCLSLDATPVVVDEAAQIAPAAR
jgi:hypothetical protein